MGDGKIWIITIKALCGFYMHTAPFCMSNPAILIYMRYLVSILISFCFSIPVHAEDINAGFVQGLWYSSDQILEGVPVRVYAALRNNTPHDLIGTVRFMDNGKRIGSAPVSALSGRLVETWIDWTPTAGEHALSVSLSDAELHVIGGETIHADVASIIVEDTLLADTDTDTDGLGNTRDTDDENDGISDEDEIARGSNPLIAQVIPLTTQEPILDAPLTTPTPTLDEKGLEQYLEEGTAHTLLGNVTEKVEDAKSALDTYRENRNAEKNSLQNNSTTTDGITRTSIQTDTSLLQKSITQIASILSSIFTGLLFTVSKLLAHPILIQISILIGILYMFYHTARKFGQRR